MINGTLERAILETLLYSDIFEYPLHLEEIHRYLPISANMEDVLQALNISNQVGMKDGFYFLAGHENIVEVRRGREVHSREVLPYALRYGRILGALPFIRMVALTGSLAVMNSAGDADFDYMIVSARGRVWTARAFALLLNRLTRRLGHTLCPNIIVAENALAWSTQDLYTAHELCQMIPIAGMRTYRALLKANEWLKDFLPNAQETPRDLETWQVSKILELPLRGTLGDRFERWEMDRKISRFSKRQGFGEETIFNAEMCQGNFDHHSQQTRQMFAKKVNEYVKQEGIKSREL